MKYSIFKNETSNLKDYLDEVSELTNKINELIYIYTGVKGVRYDGVHVNTTQHANDERLVALSEKLTPYQKRIEDRTNKIQQIENNIAKLPCETQEMVRLLFVEKCTFKQVGFIYGYSDNALHHKIKREIEKYI